MRIVALSSPTDPALGHWLRGLQRAGLEFSVVLDLKPTSDKDAEIWQQRTEGRLQPIPLSKFLPTPFYFVDDHNDSLCAELLRRLKPDLLLNCGTPRILKRDILEIPTIGVLGVHPGRLPEYRGCSCVEWALFNGDPVCNSAFLMREGIDDGPVVEIEEVPISKADSYIDIRVRTYEAGFNLMPKAIKTLQARGAKAAISAGTYWKPIDGERLETVRRLFPANSL